MAFSHEFDPARGYVALPSDVMDIEMSPGAFRLLVELCRMANRTGECWPSLGQLSERIGRSRAAISGYITELRALELVETAKQHMANGYNYRLKYCVRFWQDWRARLSAPARVTSVQKDECSVQPDECRVNSKNHIQEKQTPSVSENSDSDTAKLVSVFSKWSDLARNAPFPQFNAPVPGVLVQETRALTSLGPAKELAPDRIASRLKALWSGLNVPVPQEGIALQTETLLAKNVTAAGLHHFETQVRSTWQSHWRKPPNARQLQALLTQSQQANREEGMLRVLRQYLRRWEIAQNKLQPIAQSQSLAHKQAA